MNPGPSSSTGSATPWVAFGTAHLFGSGPGEPARSRELLLTAREAGCEVYDTAPSYGRGRSEQELGSFLRGRGDLGAVSCTTKVGLAPVLGPPAARRVAVAVARRVLPRAATERLRRSAAEAVQGHFGAEEVRASVERSVQRLGTLDRLLLHEVRPHDVTPTLRDVLRELLATGSVRVVGVATRNHLTAEVIATAPDLFTVAQYGVGPLAPRVELPSSVTTRIGHGLLGDGGRELALIRDVRDGSRELTSLWAAAVRGSEWEGPDGLPRALLGRAASLGLDGVVVATSSAHRVAETLAAATRPPGPAVLAALDALVAAAAGPGTAGDH